MKVTRNKNKQDVSLEETRFERFARLVICILMLMIMGFLTIVSLLHTSGMDIVPNLEQVSYLNDNPWFNLIFLVFGAWICLRILPKLEKIPLWAEIVFVSAWTIILGLIWVYSSQSAPTEDSGTVTSAAKAFAENNFSVFTDRRYFKDYSFQLGYVFFNEMLIRLAAVFTEVSDLLFLEALNVILLALSYIGLLLIQDILFEDQRVRHMTAFLFLFSLQPILFCSFLYGIFPGLVFAVWGVYCELIWLKKNRILFAFLSAVCIGIAVLLKSNYIIVFIAMMAVMFVELFRRKKYALDIVYMALCCLLTMTLSPAVKGMYEARSGVDLGEPIPYICWIAMGMNEPTFEGCGPGWYNAGCTVHNFERSNYDPDIASKNAMQNIKDRLQYFSKNTQYANDFFYEKFVSQWNETTYQSIWTNNVRGQYAPKTGIAAWVCSREKGQNAVEGFMDLYTQLVFASVLMGIASCIKNKEFLRIMFPLIILGGFLYHLISEAKSQYAMPYYVLMTAFAAYGLVTAYDFLCAKYGNIKWFTGTMGIVQTSVEKTRQK